ncbi:MAG: MBL fold metallo-hydrolase [Candidatus Nealsonbacteria bacterium]|nr:MBL fold metallo-hydrolase [Candidatus Nealsonbacteria bacterium]
MPDIRYRTQSDRLPRWHFTLGVAVLITVSALAVGLPVADGKVTELSEHLAVYHGPINVGIVRDGPRALLIDCGDGTVTGALPKLGIKKVVQVVFTHHHRDQACGAYDLAAGGTRIGVPKAERELFANPTSYWNDEKKLWCVSASYRPSPLTLTEPLKVDEAYSDGDELTFGPAKIRVLDTPGHTNGAVSYLVEVDGKRVVFSGDCIYDEGQVWNVYSLQKGFAKGDRRIGAYHGFMGDRWRLVESLGRIKDLHPDMLVPSHGRLMSDPAKAINTLAVRFETCYENYVAISALRHYFPELFTDYAGRAGQMPIRPGVKPPDCLRHFGTTWMLVSKTGAALVMDAGSASVVERLKKMLDRGEIKSIDGLWVTHYHNDHTAGIGAFQREFDCPCFADRRLAEVLTKPAAWRLPCLANDPIRVDRRSEDGQSWQWHEFKLTAYNYPGQTLYHDALLVESGELRMFFVGDSHTMAGIDDYCAQNRNWLGRGVGFQYCISLIEKLRPTHIFNCHVADAFTFTPEEIRFMRKNLDRREKLLGELVPWDHANYGTDASWVRCHPYTQQVRPGERVRLGVVVTNHSTKPNTVRCRAVLPKALGPARTSWSKLDVPAKAEKPLPIEFDIPMGVPSGRYVVPIDVQYGQRNLPQFTEAIVDVK